MRLYAGNVLTVRVNALLEGSGAQVGYMLKAVNKAVHIFYQSIQICTVCAQLVT